LPSQDAGVDEHLPVAPVSTAMLPPEPSRMLTSPRSLWTFDERLGGLAPAQSHGLAGAEYTLLARLPVKENYSLV